MENCEAVRYPWLVREWESWVGKGGTENESWKKIKIRNGIGDEVCPMAQSQTNAYTLS